MDGKSMVSAIEADRETLVELSRALWRHPEPAFRELFAADALARLLADDGFCVERPVAGLETAFVASWGEGRPRIGLLAEYDALPDFSQRVLTARMAETLGAPGHGCGHNLMAAAHLGAARAVRRALKERGLPGSVVLFGCPAEEVLTGKVFMARAGLFDGLDCALNFHPGAVNGVNLRSISALNNVKFTFFGTPAHAATSPFDGRSAADAAELMNVGANYLREHIPADVRMHYVLTDGGKAPNIVPERAQTWYYIRAKTRETVEEVYARLVDVAKGAALMTGTRVEVEFQGGCYPTLQNRALGALITQALEKIGPPDYTAQELDFAAALNETCANRVAQLYGLAPDTALCRAVLPLRGEGTFAYNSSDIGDVGHIVPTVMFNTACFNARADLHSWNVTACAGHSIGEKGMLYAAKALAFAAVRLFETPGLLAAAKAEFDEARAAKPYVCPIPPEVLPPQA